MKRLGVYWSVAHRRPQDYAFFRSLQPAVFKIMDGGPPDYAWARENLPNSLIIARDWAMSEQHSDMLSDPKGTGRRHAEEWNGHADRLGFDRNNTLILGINEPRVWESGMAEALRRYTIAMCDRATELGLRVGAMQLGVGWPGNTGQDMPPDWSPFHGVEDAIKRNGGMLLLHEYWADGGVGENWGWWAGRALKCPWDVPIVIGECGVDMYVKDASVDHKARGWHGRMHANRYADELVEYTQRMSEDPRFVGDAPFAADFASGEWYTFDIEPAYDAILNAANRLPDVAEVQPATQDDHKTYLPNVQSGSPEPTAAPQHPPLVISPDAEMEFRPMILDPLAMEAFIAIESGGRAFGPDGRLLIRFEAHIFIRNADQPEQAERHFRHDPDRPWEDQEWRSKGNGRWQAIHTGDQASEWAAFEVAVRMDPPAAHKAISMGAPQIVGFNHAKIGYASAKDMFDSFQRSADAQIIGLINFCLATNGMVEAIKAKDWRRMAALYNGSGNVDVYAPLLENAYRDLGG